MENNGEEIRRSGRKSVVFYGLLGTASGFLALHYAVALNSEFLAKLARIVTALNIILTAVALTILS